MLVAARLYYRIYILCVTHACSPWPVSVRLLFTLCIIMAKDIIILFFCHSVIFCHSRFLSPNAVTQFQQKPPSGALNTRSLKKLLFWTEIAVYSETQRNIAHLLWNVCTGSHRSPIDPCRFRWPWVTLNGGTRGVNFFQAIIRSYRLM